MKKILLIGGGSALLLLCILFGAFFAEPLLASARNTQSAVTTASTPATTNPSCEQYLQDLAKRLGVSVSQLQQGKLGAAKDVLAQLVKDGKLTQNQANEIQQRLQSHQACTGKGKGMWGRAVIMQSLKQYLPGVATDVASGLHISSAQLMSQLQSGKSLSEIASAHGVSSAQLQSNVTSAIKNAVNKAVSDGNLTQQQATAMMQKLQKNPAAFNRLLNAQFGKLLKLTNG